MTRTSEQILSEIADAKKHLAFISKGYANCVLYARSEGDTAELKRSCESARDHHNELVREYYATIETEKHASFEASLSDEKIAARAARMAERARTASERIARR